MRAMFSPNIERYIPDGVAYSMPVPGVCNGLLVDCVFLYLIEGMNARAPISVLKINSDTQTLVQRTLSEMRETVPIVVLNEKNDVLVNVYKELYALVRDMFGNRALNPDVSTVKRFNKTLLDLAGKEMIKIYKIASPEFFDWIDNQIG